MDSSDSVERAAPVIERRLASRYRYLQSAIGIAAKTRRHCGTVLEREAAHLRGLEHCFKTEMRQALKANRLMPAAQASAVLRRAADLQQAIIRQRKTKIAQNEAYRAARADEVHLIGEIRAHARASEKLDQIIRQSNLVRQEAGDEQTMGAITTPSASEFSDNSPISAGPATIECATFGDGSMFEALACNQMAHTMSDRFEPQVNIQNSRRAPERDNQSSKKNSFESESNDSQVLFAYNHSNGETTGVALRMNEGGSVSLEFSIDRNQPMRYFVERARRLRHAFALAAIPIEHIKSRCSQQRGGDDC